MKIGASVTAGPVRDRFAASDGPRIILDFTQGRHGRVFCGDHCYDLPDPRERLPSVDSPAATLEIIGFQGIPSIMGPVNVQSLKAVGDLHLPTARAKRFELAHCWLEAAEISGTLRHPNQAPDGVEEILLLDSRLTSRGEIAFANLIADDRTESFVQAIYLEGLSAQGKVLLAADLIVVGVLDAQEVQAGRPDGCRVAQIFCDRVVQRLARGETIPIRPVYDADLVAALQPDPSSGIAGLKEFGID